MKKIKIIITTILLCFLCTGIVFAENGINTDDLTVSPSARSHDHVKKAPTAVKAEKAPTAMKAMGTAASFAPFL